jgi:PAS domain S-box-containing protein
MEEARAPRFLETTLSHNPQFVRYQTACALAESATLTEAMPHILQAVCDGLDWQFGAYWEVDRAHNVLRCLSVWQPPSLPFEAFGTVTGTSTFAPGVGLPGRVWVSRQFTWIPDVTRDSNFPRAAAAARAGLHAAFALPILQGDVAIGVMEFFSRNIGEPTPELLAMLTAVSSQVASFVERRWAGEDLDRFFTLSLDLFCVATFEGYFLKVNPAWQRVLGFSEAELRAAPFMDFVHPDDRAATAAALSTLTTGEGVIGFENRYRARNGSYKWLQWTSAPLPKQGLVYAVARDITDRRIADDALLVYAHEMELAKHQQEQNAQRLAQLVKELDVSRQRAEQATTAKGAFLANMSHEIRTPMNAIIGMTDLVLGTRLTARQRDWMRSARQSAEALLTIINDILDVSKIEAGRLTLDPALFDVRNTVEDSVKLLAPRAEERGLELACRIAPEVPHHVVGDAGRLRQVLLNLVGNAIKFTDQGEVVVDVELDGTTATDLTLRFTVTDTGIGIAPEKQWEIFGAFVQADASTTRRYGGTGLGLTISAQLIELMGGRVWIDSEVGKGSRFHFMARFGLDLGERPPAPAAALPTIPDLRAIRALIVDDNATNRLILSELLASWQMQAEAVDGAAAALSALSDADARRAPFHLVLTDALMPDGDGFSLAEQIKNDQRLAATKVLLLSSAGFVQKPASAEATAGSKGRTGALFAASLTKPVKQSDLLDAIVTAFAGPAAPERPAPRRRVRKPRRTEPQSLRVLVAEDNLTNQKLLVTLLEQRGHRVVTVGNGRQAVDAVSHEPFDVVVMDVQMPEMGGLEATAAIRARERTTGGHIPIVALTAHAMPGDREQCLAAGMDGYVSKPLRPDELFATLDGIVTAESASTPRPAVPGPIDPIGGNRAPSVGVDRADLLAGLGGNANLLDEVIGVFLADVPALIERMRAAASSAEAGALAAAAHAIKGAVGFFSRGGAYECVRRLEHIARAGDLAHSDRACREVVDAVTELTGELIELRKTLRGR